MLSNVIMRYNTMQERVIQWKNLFIQCENMFIDLSMQKSCYPTWKSVIQCKKCAIQSNKRDILHNKKTDRKIVIAKKKWFKYVIKIKKYHMFFAFLVLLCPLLSKFYRIPATFMSLFVPFCSVLFELFCAKGEKRDVRPPIIQCQ